MKKGLRKLILSGTALAAVAATLGTSTYAWYVANDTVKATGITGASAASSAASIFISRNTTEWGSEVSLAGTIANGEIPDGYVGRTVGQAWVKGGALIPVEYTGVASNADTFKVLGTISDQGAYVPAQNVTSSADGASKEFTLYFRTSLTAEENAPTVYLKSISITNQAENAAALTGADNLNFKGSDSTVGGVNNTDAKYKVDIIRSLGLTIHTNATGANVGNVNGTALDPQPMLNPFNSVAVADGSADALAYYNKYMDTNYTYAMNVNKKKAIQAADYVAQSGETLTPITLGKLDYTGETYMTATFSIYLDGWDTFCFDACKGQDFNVEVQFTSDSSEALKMVTVA